MERKTENTLNKILKCIIIAVILFCSLSQRVYAEGMLGVATITITDEAQKGQDISFTVSGNNNHLSYLTKEGTPIQITLEEGLYKIEGYKTENKDTLTNTSFEIKENEITKVDINTPSVSTEEEKKDSFLIRFLKDNAIVLILIGICSAYLLIRKKQGISYTPSSLGYDSIKDEGESDEEIF